jgi:hypothetical protein
VTKIIVGKMEIPTNKKRKLNSKNPKYNKSLLNNVKMHKILIKEVKGCKIYKAYYL